MGSQSSIKEYFSPLQPLREIKISVFLFFTQTAKSAEFLFPLSYFTLALKGGRKLRYDKVRKAFYPPPPPCGVLAPISGGESVTTGNIKLVDRCSFPFSVFCFHLYYSPLLHQAKASPFSVYFVPLRQAGRGAKRRRGWIVLVIVIVFVQFSALIPLRGLDIVLVALVRHNK